jgi:hypothetical protein
VRGGPSSAKRGNTARQKASAVKLSNQSSPSFLFWTVILVRANVNVKEPIERNAGANAVSKLDR